MVFPFGTSALVGIPFFFFFLFPLFLHRIIGVSGRTLVILQLASAVVAALGKVSSFFFRIDSLPFSCSIVVIVLRVFL